MTKHHSSRSRYGLLAPAMALLLASSLHGQVPPRIPPSVLVGGDLERYLRILQVTGAVEAYPWAVSGPSRIDVMRTAAGESAHLWDDRYRLEAPGAENWVSPLDPELRAVYNSAFPFGGDDGAAWSGRGINTEVSAGVAARYGPFRLTVAPVLVWSENRAFDLAEHPESERFPYANADHPTAIDLPQRFGDGSFGRIDPGQSTLRVDARGIGIGVSSANERWGPGEDYPIVLGGSAPGFIHGFAETSRPWGIGIGQVHGRIIWGRLEQSAYSTVPEDSAARYGSGLVGVFVPRGFPGLEIGAAYFNHARWPAKGITLGQLLGPFENLSKLGLFDLDDPDVAFDGGNEIASVFARWIFPRSGVELFGEFASDDRRHNLRDLTLQPDHNSAYNLGLRKVWTREGALIAFRAEVLNAAPSHLARNRRQETFYIHATLRQGHTHRGEVLGTPAAFGGGGTTLEVERITESGRISLAWRRMVRREGGAYLETGIEDRPDVLHSLGAELLLFRGRWDLTTGVAGAYDLNRDFQRDALNFQLVTGLRARL